MTQFLRKTALALNLEFRGAVPRPDPTMSDGKSKSPYRGPDRRAPIDASAAGAPTNPLGHAIRRGPKIGGRHAAITNDLYSWHSYKNWTEKVRGSWDVKK